MSVKNRIRLIWGGLAVIVTALVGIACLPAPTLDAIASRAGKMVHLSTILFQGAAVLYTLTWLVPYFQRMEAKTDRGLAASADIGKTLATVQAEIKPIVEDVKAVTADIRIMVEKDIHPVLDKVRAAAERADAKNIEDKLQRAIDAIESIADRLKPPAPPEGVDVEAPLERLRARGIA